MNRTWIIVGILILCIIDLAATYYYVYTYKSWQPEKPYSIIELNPLLSFLWNQLGLHLGMIVGAVALITLNYIVAKNAHWSVVLILGLFLVFAMYNHFTNINLLHKLMELYPQGYLPVETFGEVIGNNPK